MKIYKKGILPIGFKASAVACGIKKPGKLDLALFYSELPAKAACKFTSNKILAAPVKLDIKHLSAGKGFRAIIANSGNANCFTGKNGLEDAQLTAEKLAGSLKIKKESVFVASTGIIGKRLPIARLTKAIPGLVEGLSEKGIDEAKLAIMTTDKFAKDITVKFRVGDSYVSVCAVAKGAGMIAPNMATMLVFILTDANITQPALNKALTFAVDNSFNCITVDGCMSTNDSVICLANGAAGNVLIDSKSNFELFAKALNTVCLELAKLIVADAEGATKFIRIKVEQAKSFNEARVIALTIANSNLFKTAVFGENPNFGRVVASVGSSGIDIKEKDLKVRLGALNKKCVDVNVSVNRGKFSAIIYTSDLTPEYIKINAEYN